jgi:hypothetical protein
MNTSTNMELVQRMLPSLMLYAMLLVLAVYTILCMEDSE